MRKPVAWTRRFDMSYYYYYISSVLTLLHTTTTTTTTTYLYVLLLLHIYMYLYYYILSVRTLLSAYYTSAWTRQFDMWSYSKYLASSYLYMCPHTTMCPQVRKPVSWTIGFLMLLCVLIPLYGSSYYYMYSQVRKPVAWTIGFDPADDSSFIPEGRAKSVPLRDSAPLRERYSVYLRH
jgi:hypothetical protein